MHLDIPEALREKGHSFLQSPKKIRTPLLVFMGLGWNPGLCSCVASAGPLGPNPGPSSANVSVLLFYLCHRSYNRVCVCLCPLILLPMLVFPLFYVCHRTLLFYYCSFIISIYTLQSMFSLLCCFLLQRCLAYSWSFVLPIIHCIVKLIIHHRLCWKPLFPSAPASGKDWLWGQCCSLQTNVSRAGMEGRECEKCL